MIALYIALVVAGIPWISPSHEPALFIGYIVLLTLLLIAVCWIKGEPPRWRFGARDRV